MTGKKIRGLDKGIVGTLVKDGIGECKIYDPIHHLSIELPKSAMCTKPAGKVKKAVAAKLEDPTPKNLLYLEKKYGVVAKHLEILAEA